MSDFERHEALLPDEVVEQVRQDAISEGMDPDAAVRAAEAALTEQGE